MKFSGKTWLMIILKVTKNQRFTISLEDTLFEKPQGGGGSQIDPPPPPQLFMVKSILPERLNNSLWQSYVLLFSEFANIVSILFYIFIEFIILLHTFLVISFAKYKEDIIWRISFIKPPNLFPGFIWARAIGNLWRICLGVSILSPFLCFALYLASDSKKE